MSLSDGDTHLLTSPASTGSFFMTVGMYFNTSMSISITFTYSSHLKRADGCATTFGVKTGSGSAAVQEQDRLDPPIFSLSDLRPAEGERNRTQKYTLTRGVEGKKQEERRRRRKVPGTFTDPVEPGSGRFPGVMRLVRVFVKLCT